MHDMANISERLETYLAILSEIHDRWSAWLHNIEQAVVGIDDDRLQQITTTASALMGELKGVLETRQTLLADAKAQGFSAPDLSSLARSLPQWKDPELRRKVAKAKSQLGHLRRLHFSTWVVMHQTVQHFGHVMRMLTHGSAKPDVYTDTRHADNQGGRLLNANA